MAKGLTGFILGALRSEMATWAVFGLGVEIRFLNAGHSALWIHLQSGSLGAPTPDFTAAGIVCNSLLLQPYTLSSAEIT